jgi:hypothetical protein
MTIPDDVKNISPVIKSGIEFAEEAVPLVTAGIAILDKAGDYFPELKKAFSFLDGPPKEDPIAKLHEQIIAISEKLDEVYEEVEKLRGDISAADKHEIRINIADKGSYIKTTRESAWSHIKAPDNNNDKITYEHQRAEAEPKMDALRDNQYYWDRLYLGRSGPYKGEKYPGVYEDVWSGPIEPDPEWIKDRYIWDYRLALSVYQCALNDWMICLLASGDPVYVRDHNKMDQHIPKLQKTLETILKGYKSIRAPNKDEIQTILGLITVGRHWVVETIFSNPEDLPFSEEPWLSNLRSLFLTMLSEPRDPYWGDDQEAVYDHHPANFNDWLERYRSFGSKWIMSKFVYGMVQMHTGLASTGSMPQNEFRSIKSGALEFHEKLFPEKVPTYPYIDWVSGINPFSIDEKKKFDIYYDDFIFKHTLRTWAQARNLSYLIGLQELRDTICELSLAFGLKIPPLPDEWDKYVVISIRQLISLIPEHWKNEKNFELGSIRSILRIRNKKIPEISIRGMFLEIPREPRENNIS